MIFATEPSEQRRSAMGGGIGAGAPHAAHRHNCYRPRASLRPGFGSTPVARLAACWLPPGRHHRRAIYPRFRRRPVARQSVGRDPRDPSDVRRRPAFLAQRPDVSPGCRAAGCGRADRGRHVARSWLGLDARLGDRRWARLRPRAPVASTVVLIRSLQERRIFETERGRIAVGWLIVEDLAMVVALVLLPAFGGALGGAETGGAPSWGSVAFALGLPLVKVAAFVAVMLVAGRRVVPWLMHYTAHTGSRELFRLSVYAVAFGVAYGAAALFGVSFALGAFFAGMVLAESPLSQRATEEAMPLRDAFAVLFFVSVGMLFNPGVLLREPWAVLATIAIIVLGKSIAAFAIVRAFGRPTTTALTISASLVQIGEFSFILAGLGVAMGVLPREGSDLILAGAIISILLNPMIFAVVERRRTRTVRALAAEAPNAAGVAAPEPPPATAPPPAPAVEEAAPTTTTLTGHDVVVGSTAGSAPGSERACARRGARCSSSRRARKGSKPPS